MSALGHKRTFCAVNCHVRFTPESGHVVGVSGMSAKRQKRTSSTPALWGILAVLRSQRNHCSIFVLFAGIEL